MLPDVGGTSLKALWNASDEATVNLSWNFNPGDFTSVDSLVLVAFVQNEYTKEVYQSAYISFAQMLGTGYQTLLEPEGIGFRIYPNPATDIAYIEFENALSSITRLEIFNEVGAKMMDRVLEAGIRRAELLTRHLGRGVYFIRLRTGRASLGMDRLVIIR